MGHDAGTKKHRDVSTFHMGHNAGTKRLGDISKWGMILET